MTGLVTTIPQVLMHCTSSEAKRLTKSQCMNMCCVLCCIGFLGQLSVRGDRQAAKRHFKVRLLKVSFIMSTHAAWAS